MRVDSVRLYLYVVSTDHVSPHSRNGFVELHSDRFIASLRLCLTNGAKLYLDPWLMQHGVRPDFSSCCKNAVPPNFFNSNV